jgi:hypothetical protein
MMLRSKSWRRKLRALARRGRHFSFFFVFFFFFFFFFSFFRPAQAPAKAFSTSCVLTLSGDDRL